jgi:hypothetical protein
MTNYDRMLSVTSGNIIMIGATYTVICPEVVTTKACLASKDGVIIGAREIHVNTTRLPFMTHIDAAVRHTMKIKIRQSAPQYNVGSTFNELRQLKFTKFANP